MLYLQAINTNAVLNRGKKINPWVIFPSVVLQYLLKKLKFVPLLSGVINYRG